MTHQIAGTRQAHFRHTWIENGVKTRVLTPRLTHQMTHGLTHRFDSNLAVKNAERVDAISGNNEHVPTWFKPFIPSGGKRPKIFTSKLAAHLLKACSLSLYFFTIKAATL
jgi:hypothetical protein